MNTNTNSTITTDSASTERFHRSLRQTGVFVYRHSAALVVVSICWCISSLPLVTVGPATLGAYSAIHSLRNEDREMMAVLGSLRRHGVNAALLGFVPVIVCVVTILYFYRYLTTSSVQHVILAIVGVYLLSFLSLVVLTTFTRLADGSEFDEAIKDSYAWVVNEPLLSTLTVLVSGVILLVGVISVVGLFIIVPAILFGFHTEVIQRSLTTVDPDGDR